MTVIELSLNERYRYVAVTADTLPTTADAGDLAHITDGPDKLFNGTAWVALLSASAPAATIADGANVVEGSTTDAAVSTDANGTINAHIRGLVKLLVAKIGITIADGDAATLGVTTGAAVVTDVNGTVQQYLRGIVKLLIATLKVTLTPVGSVAPTNVTSSALEASHVLKNAAGTLWGMSGFNNKTSGQYIQLYDSATIPADTAVPVLTQWVPAQSPFTFDFGLYGRGFAAGIAIANSSTLATKTIGSADCWFDAQLT